MQTLSFKDYKELNQEWEETLTERERRSRNHQVYRRGNPSKYMMSQIQRSARNRRLEFNLTLEDFYIPEVCPILGIPFNYDVVNLCPSVDRLDNTKGYIKGNICIMSTLANRMKFQADFKLWRAFAEGTIQFLDKIEKGSNAGRAINT